MMRDFNSLRVAFSFSLCLIPYITNTASGGMNFKLTSMSKCSSYASGFLTKYGISLEDCVNECSARPRCNSINYFRIRHACVLMNESSSFETVTSCINIKKEHFLVASPCVCPLNGVCINGQDGYNCIIKECEPVQFDYGGVQGDRVTIGSVIKYICRDGYVPSGQTDTLTCMGSGNWSRQAECVIGADCGEPDDGTRSTLLPGDTTTGSHRVYVCDPRHVLVTDSLATNVTVECMVTGSWSLEGIVCVKEVLIGDECYVSADCSSTMAECIADTCFCNALYRWNATLKDCAKVCQEVTNEFAVYPEVFLEGYNDRTLGNTNISECMASCIADPTCLHFEDRYDFCAFGNVTMEMLIDASPSDIKENVGDRYAVYSRLCN